MSENTETTVKPPDLIQVAREKLEALTEAIDDNWGRTFTREGSVYYACIFCGKSEKDYFRPGYSSPFGHDENCPVLIATSITPKA